MLVWGASCRSQDRSGLEPPLRRWQRGPRVRVVSGSSLGDQYMSEARRRDLADFQPGCPSCRDPFVSHVNTVSAGCLAE